MAAHGKSNVWTRKSRYVPDATAVVGPLPPFTLLLLQRIAQFRFLTVRQLALLTGRSDQSVRRALRAAFDLELVAIIVIPRVFAIEGAIDPTSLAFGSSPNVYKATPKGMRLLKSLGLEIDAKPAPSFSPTSLWFVRHELLVRDVLIFIHCCAVENCHSLTEWHLGDEATMTLGRTELPRVARPDAWLTYKFAQHTLAACLEVDRGTEKGETRWLAKLTAYRLLLGTDAFKAATGSAYGRVLTITVTQTRRDSLAALIAKNAEPELADRFYLVTASDLVSPTLSQAVWRHPSEEILVPLIPADLLCRGPDQTD